jgi:DNA-binding HxlR family transcriptional regulator
MDSARSYRHFCLMARALEEVGERWSLLIVRDLMLGPQRFTDLRESLGGITPTRLTNRLRSLEAAGIIVREPAPTGREVWYRLTKAGEDLGPVVDALTLWGLEHAFRSPSAGEPVHPDHVMLGNKTWLISRDVRPATPIVWVWRFPPDWEYSLQYDGGEWKLARGATEPATLTIAATTDAWARFMTSPLEGRRLPREDVELSGKRGAIREFVKAYGAAPR